MWSDRHTRLQHATRWRPAPIRTDQWNTSRLDIRHVRNIGIDNHDMKGERVVLALAIACQLIGLFIFARGFFPLSKPSIKGVAAPLDHPEPAFDRMIFVVIDALRSDLAYGDASLLPNLHELIDRGKAIPFTAKASTPTVTLPRLKCLVTGSISSFLDAVLNIAESDTISGSALQDNWVTQAQSHDKRIHMYGDDTWIRLFPDTFDRTDGTSSFYVNDFTEVDANVTGHIDDLKRDNWDIAILHYLGLDHIGHIGGPRSVHMPDKQREMDNVIGRLASDLVTLDKLDGKRSFMVVTGDHGMTEQGNHGGATEGEVLTAAIFISEHFQSTRPSVYQTDTLHFYNTILQSDLVPSISALLGLPFPLNSIGVVPEAILEQLSSPSQHLRRNAHQLQQLLAAGASDEPTQHALCTSPPCRLSSIDLDSMTTSDALSVMRDVQGRLLQVSSDFNVESMVIGAVMQLVAVLTMLFLWWSATTASLLRLALPLLWGATTFASSFIEEEHSFWYFIINICLLFEATRRADTAMISLTAFGLLRHMNQTGDKYAHFDDISGFLSRHTELRSTAIVLSFLFFQLRALQLGSRASPLRQVVFGSALGLIAAAKYGQDTHLAVRLVWVLGLVSQAPGLGRRLPARLIVGAVYLLQTRPIKWPLLALMECISPTDDATFFALSQASFFAMGNGNSLARLDLSQAYNGVTAYNELLVGVLLFISTMAAPLYWTVRWTACAAERCNKGSTVRGDGVPHLYMPLCSCIYTTLLSAACLALRHHLFVFSVFSPKFLYACAWSVFYALAAIYASFVAVAPS